MERKLGKINSQSTSKSREREKQQVNYLISLSKWMQTNYHKEKIVKQQVLIRATKAESCGGLSSSISWMNMTHTLYTI